MPTYVFITISNVQAFIDGDGDGDDFVVALVTRLEGELSPLAGPLAGPLFRVVFASFLLGSVNVGSLKEVSLCTTEGNSGGDGGGK